MASIIKTDNIQKVSDDSNIIKKCGSTITLGSCGASVALASGATQTGFGRTGTVDWCTTAKTSPFTAVSGDGYFLNTTSGAVTVTLPASPSAGDIVSVSDYAKTAQTNNIIVGRNSSNIDGEAVDLILDTNGIATTLVYVDGTKGWKPVNSNEVVNEIKYVTAAGGTETTCGDFKIHTFNSDSNFIVSCAGTAGGSNKVSYVVVAGGAGGGFDAGGGGGAGGFREGKCTSDPYTDSPLDAGVGLPVGVQTYPITIGAGGNGGPSGAVTSGTPSLFSTITSAGGGRGYSNPAPLATTGGSGGGGGRGNNGAAGNTPPVSPPQGNTGGNSSNPQNMGGGGGGATVAGGDGTPSAANCESQGGAGATSSINGTPTARAGGGGGSVQPGLPATTGSGGTGGGGAGGNYGPVPVGANGTANTGGGGGGGPGYGAPYSGGSGGSGVVIIRYKFQN